MIKRPTFSIFTATTVIAALLVAIPQLAAWTQESVYVDQTRRPARVIADRLTPTEIVGMPVSDRTWRQIGRVEQLMIDADSGRVSSVLVSVVNEPELYVVPWETLAIDGEGRVHLDMTDRELASLPRVAALAPVLRRPAPRPLPDVADELGRGLEPEGDVVAPQLIFARRQRAQASFDPSSHVVFRASVVGVVTASFGGPMRQVVLIADSDSAADNARVRVELGPEWYVAGRGFDFEPDDPILVEGSRAVVDGESVIRATAVTTGDGTLRLRHRDGRPLWLEESD